MTFVTWSTEMCRKWGSVDHSGIKPVNLRSFSEKQVKSTRK